MALSSLVAADKKEIQKKTTCHKNVNTTVVCVSDDEGEYCADRALSVALHDWMEELNQPLHAGKINK